MLIRYLIFSIWTFGFITGCSDEDGNLIHDFSKLVGEENFSIVASALDKTTQFGIIAGEVAGFPAITIASGVANLGLGWCLNKYENEKTQNTVAGLNEQLKLLERRLVDRIDALQITIYKNDLKNILAHNLKDDDIGKKIILNSDYDGQVYLPFRDEIDETIKTLLILLGYCETVRGRQNITNNNHYVIANRSLSRLHEQISSDNNFIKHGFWPNSINNTVKQILKEGEEYTNAFVKDQISKTLKKKYPWTNFTVIVYDPISGHKHLLVDSSLDKHTLHYFRFAGKNCIIFQSPYDEDMIHNMLPENYQPPRQLACKRMNTLYDMYSVFSNKSTTNENTIENHVVSTSLDREELCHMKQFIPSMCIDKNNFEIIDSLRRHGISIIQVLVASDANIEFELEGGTFPVGVGQSCEKGGTVKMYDWFFYSYVPGQRYFDYLKRKEHQWKQFLKQLQWLKKSD